MTAKQTSEPAKDVLIVVAVLAVFVAAYLVLRTPPHMPQAPAGNPAAANQQEAHTFDNLPTDYDALVVMGNRSMDDGNFSMAAECYRRALEINGASSDVRTDFGACLHAMNLPERALQEFKKVIDSDPNHAMSRFNSGIVYANSGQIDSARVYFEKYLTMAPGGSASETARRLLSEMGK